MRRLPLVLIVLVLTIGTNATASEGVNLRWTNCLSDGGLSNRNFACTSNSGDHVLIGSFELGSDIPYVSGQEFTLDVTTTTGTLPAWWMFKNPSTCRMTSLAVNFLFPVTSVNCVDWANGQSAGGLAAYNIGFITPNRARILGVVAVPLAAILEQLDPATEYYSFSIVINNAKTVGAGACPGCATAANIYFGRMKVTSAAWFGFDRVLTHPANGFDSNLATWQGGFPTATRRETWGAVKALYR